MNTIHQKSREGHKGGKEWNKDNICEVLQMKSVARQRNRSNFAKEWQQKTGMSKDGCGNLHITDTSKQTWKLYKQVWYVQIPDNTGGITFWWKCGTLKHIPTHNCKP